MHVICCTTNLSPLILGGIIPIKARLVSSVKKKGLKRDLYANKYKAMVIRLDQGRFQFDLGLLAKLPTRMFKHSMIHNYPFLTGPGSSLSSKSILSNF